MSKFLHDDDADDRAMAIPQCFLRKQPIKQDYDNTLTFSSNTAELKNRQGRISLCLGFSLPKKSQKSRPVL